MIDTQETINDLMQRDRAEIDAMMDAARADVQTLIDAAQDNDLQALLMRQNATECDTQGRKRA